MNVTIGVPTGHVSCSQPAPAKVRRVTVRPVFVVEVLIGVAAAFARGYVPQFLARWFAAVFSLAHTQALRAPVFVHRS